MDAPVELVGRSLKVGPLGKSTHTDLQPVMVPFDGCVRTDDEDNSGNVSYRRREGRLLIIPKDDANEYRY